MTYYGQVPIRKDERFVRHELRNFRAGINVITSRSYNAVWGGQESFILFPKMYPLRVSWYIWFHRFVMSKGRNIKVTTTPTVVGISPNRSRLFKRFMLYSCMGLHRGISLKFDVMEENFIRNH